MINLIYGAKGTGKTKLIIDKANDAVVEAKGNIVFLTDKKGYNYHINNQIRLCLMAEYNINSDIDFLGFIKGLIAGNSDIEHFYIDGLHRICRKSISELEDFFNNLYIITETYSVEFTLAISLPEEEMPKYLDKYYK